MADLAVLAIPALLAAGLVLLGVGASGQVRPVRSRQWTSRFQDWTTQAGVRGVRPWHVVGCRAGRGRPPAWPCRR